MPATLPLSTVVPLPLPRRSAEAVSAQPAPARREIPPDRYWDVSQACWVSCAGRAGG